MALGINQYGIVHRLEEGPTMVLRPGKNGGIGIEIEVPANLADEHRLATGDIVAGTTESVGTAWPETAVSDEVMEDEAAWDEQVDEPTAIRHVTVPNWLMTRPMPTERLATVTAINGFPVDEAEDRPFPRTRRSNSERTPPDRLVQIAVNSKDETGRMLDFAAPLGLGGVGIVYGPHGSGLTRTLKTVLNGLLHNAKEAFPVVLLLRARGEEITDWRRQFPGVDVVVCPSTAGEATPEQTLRLADLVLEAAQRQTESGKDVVLFVDSLTGLWGTMLEAEAADAQKQADQSRARRRMREWVQKAGCFHGEGPLGAGPGGSLTIIGSLWHHPVDKEAEEEGEIHPHLRLLEHLIHETGWRVPLSGELTRLRLYPALDIKQCLSQQEDHLLPREIVERLRAVRSALPRNNPIACYDHLLNAIERTSDLDSLLQHLSLTVPAEVTGAKLPELFRQDEE